MVVMDESSVIPQLVYSRGTGKAEETFLSSSGGIAEPAMIPNLIIYQHILDLNQVSVHTDCKLDRSVRLKRGEFISSMNIVVTP